MPSPAMSGMDGDVGDQVEAASLDQVGDQADVADDLPILHPDVACHGGAGPAFRRAQQRGAAGGGAHAPEVIAAIGIEGVGKAQLDQVCDRAQIAAHVKRAQVLF